MITTDEILNMKQEQGPQGLISVLGKRFSTRVFDGSPVPEDEINYILEAGRWAPSSGNRQPWYYFWAIKGTEGFDKLFSLGDEGNQLWIGSPGALILGCAITEDEKGKNPYAKFDLGESVMSMCVEALARGYYTHPFSGFDREKSKQMFNIPEKMKPFVMLGIGKIGNYAQATEILQKKDMRERIRKEDFAKQI